MHLFFQEIWRLWSSFNSAAQLITKIAISIGALSFFGIAGFTGAKVTIETTETKMMSFSIAYLSVVLGFIVLIGSIVLAWHTVPRLMFVREKMRHGDYDGYYSVAIKNMSKTTSTEKPIVEIISCNKPDFVNLPIPLHQQKDDYNEAKRLDIYPDGEGIFDVIKFDKNSGKWKVVGENDYCRYEVPANEYELVLVASAKNCCKTRPQKVVIKNIDGRPHIDLSF